MDGGSGEELFDDVVEQVVDYAIIRLDPHGRILSWNRGAERLTGYTAEEAGGRSFAIFYPPEDRRAGVPEQLLAVAGEDGRAETAGWRIRKDGTTFWADVVITALHDREGNLTGYGKVTRDLTEHHELEAALRASEERLRLLVGQVVDYAIIALDRDGVIQTWNRGAELVKGYTAEEAVGRSFAMFYTESDRRSGLPTKLLDRAREEGRVEHAGWRVRKDGSRFWGDVVITALHDDDGNLTGYAKVTRDRTDLKALEMAQDAFYTAFSHDFRTPLTAMRGFVDAIRDAADDDERERLIDRVETSADRLLAMVEGLVRFATQREAHAELLLEDIDLGHVVRSAVEDLPERLEPERVRVADDVVIARANGIAMHRVVTNLLVNALKYSDSDTPVDVTFGRPRPGVVRLSVSDHGRGIDPRDVDSIFDEFVRGRLAEDDGGTGVGLASVRELVEQQEGTIEIDTRVGVGTTVSIDVASPRALKAAAPSQRTASAPPVSAPAVSAPAARPASSPAGQSRP